MARASTWSRTHAHTRTQHTPHNASARLACSLHHTSTTCAPHSGHPHETRPDMAAMRDGRLVQALPRHHRRCAGGGGPMRFGLAKRGR
eukprot:2388438-Pyramimonas_sp.AAC.1